MHDQVLKRFFGQRTKEVEAEKLILEATELIVKQMELENISRTELARRLGKTKSYVSQVLSGERNITLRTLAEICFELSCRVKLEPQSFVSPSLDESVGSRHVHEPAVMREDVEYMQEYEVE